MQDVIWPVLAVPNPASAYPGLQARQYVCAAELVSSKKIAQLYKALPTTPVTAVTAADEGATHSFVYCIVEVAVGNPAQG